jgi:predicted site-specific integrase-resolvase
MSYTLGEAAKAVGKSKTTLHRAIKSGKISASKADDGSYVIEPSESPRVYWRVKLSKDEPHGTEKISPEVHG